MISSLGEKQRSAGGPCLFRDMQSCVLLAGVVLVLVTARSPASSTFTPLCVEAGLVPLV